MHFSLEEKMKKVITLIMVVAMVATMASVVFAADVAKVDPLAAYDFTGGKLADQTGKQAAIVLDDEPLDADGKEVRTDDERKSLESHSARATAGENGITMLNGFFKLPENMFSKASEVTGITVSLTYTKEADYGWGSTWSEHLFAFSDKWITDELKDGDTMNYADRADSFFATRNGNVATSKTPYGADGSWMDGTLGEDYAKDGAFVNVTVTYDPATNVACIYKDGELVKSSADNADVKAVLTVDMIKNFKYGVVGLPIGGDWGMWSFMTVKDLTVYSSALNADQVKVLATNGWKSLSMGGATSGNGNGGASQTGVATVALAIAAITSGAYVVSKKRH